MLDSALRTSCLLGLMALCACGAQAPTRPREAPSAQAEPPAAAASAMELPPRYEPPADSDPDGPRIALMASAVATADSNGCAVARDGGEVWCWGFTMHPSVGPVRLVGPHDVIALDITDDSGCAATSEGEVWCWGFALRGDGLVRSRDDATRPEIASRADIDRVIDVDVGHGQSCVVQGDGRVACWGCLWPPHWQRADECPHRAASPEVVRGIDDAVEVAVGGAIACARRRDDRVVCWGGTLGPDPRDVGIPLSSSLTGEFDDVCGVSRWQDVWCLDAQRGYRVIPELRGVVQVTVGGSSRCGARADGTVVCQDDIERDRTQDSVAQLREVVRVAHNREATCALFRDGRVGCIGDDRMGGAGHIHGSRRYSPSTIEGLADVVQISSGASVTCARRQDGSVACWGARPGLVGVTDRRPRSRPTELAIPPAIDVSVGITMACAVHEDGHVTCWADDDDGPQPPSAAVGIQGARDVAASEDACVVIESGEVWCFSSYARGREPQMISGLPSMVAVGVGSHRTFVGRARDGSTWSWRTNLINGHVGSGERLRRVGAIAATSMESCAIDSVGDLRCESQFGDGVQLLAHDVMAVAAGQNHGCMILAGGAVDCWGEMSGGLGSPEDRFALRRVPLDAPATSIVCGDSHTCTLLASGRASCWGERGQGALGDGTVAIHEEPSWITVPVP